MNFEEFRAPEKPEKPVEPKPRKKRQSKTDTSGFAKTLQGIHLSLAFLTRIEELAIEENEAQALATAINGVLEEFDLTMSPQAQALANLAMVSASIYAPRVFLIRQKLAAEKKDKEENESDKTG